MRSVVLLRCGNDSVMCSPPTYCLPPVSSKDKGWCGLGPVAQVAEL